MTSPPTRGHERIRSWLFVPGSRPERFDKAAASGTDAVIIDLEDAVARSDKQTARDAVQEWLRMGTAYVRINGLNTKWCTADLDAVTETPGLHGIVVPKAEDPSVLAELAERLSLDKPLIALIESAAGLASAEAIAETQGVARLAFGNIDFADDLDIMDTQENLRPARLRLTMASRVAGIARPIDGVTTELSDNTACFRDARHAAELGFGGKFCLHPRQIEAIHRGFHPQDEDLAWARKVLAAAGHTDGAATRVEGEMVDKPQLQRAYRLLERAGERPGTTEGGPPA